MGQVIDLSDLSNNVTDVPVIRNKAASNQASDCVTLNLKGAEGICSTPIVLVDQGMKNLLSPDKEAWLTSEVMTYCATSMANDFKPKGLKILPVQFFPLLLKYKQNESDQNILNSIDHIFDSLQHREIGVFDVNYACFIFSNAETFSVDSIPFLGDHWVLMVLRGLGDLINGKSLESPVIQIFDSLRRQTSILNPYLDVLKK